MTRRRKSIRELEKELEDLDPGSTRGDREWRYQEQRDEAQERWQADAYDQGSFQRLWDAYALAYEGWDEYIAAMGATISYFGFVRSKFRRPERTVAEADLPPVPTERVVDAIEAFGRARGIDAVSLRSRHPEDWVARFVEELYFETERKRAERIGYEWSPDETEANIRQWRGRRKSDRGRGVAGAGKETRRGDR